MTTNNSSSKSIWVVTSSLNEYGQHGDYLVGFFHEKPTPAQLSVLTGRTEEYWVESPDGGRHGVEHEWYHVVELKEGSEYEHRL